MAKKRKTKKKFWTKRKKTIGKALLKFGWQVYKHKKGLVK